MDWHKPQHQIHPPPPPTLTKSHPSFSVTEDRALSLRETGSQIVIQTLENALRQGGLALLGEGFQLDSSLSYHSGDNEGIEGDLDVVIPLWNGGRHAIFTQPGFVFWKGLEGEKRFDGNIGLVYRAELTRGLIAGASIFYDQDFEIGHSRVSGGLDLQSGFFRFGANYYHPLSEVEDGREGFVEEALRGMDARLVFEREAVRLGSTIGYWEYDGGEDVEDEWKTSIGLDFGVRILPGVFAEASWERHKDDIVLDERIFAGLAFRFSLPGFEGASYGSGEMTSNLYKIVDREKRILYEERVGLPSISISLPDSVSTDGMSAAIAEDNTVELDIQLSQALTEDVTLNLVASGSAEYGSSNDWNLSVGGTDCASATETVPCQVVIGAGDTSASVEVSINDDGRTEDLEAFNISIGLDLEIAHLVRIGSGSNLSFTIPSEITNTVRFASSTAVATEGGGAASAPGTRFAQIDLEITNVLTNNIDLTLVFGGDAEDGDYNFFVSLGQEGGTLGAGYSSNTGVYTMPINTTIPVLILEALQETGNAADTDNETVTIQLTDPNNNLPPGWVIEEPSTITVTIMDEG